VFIASVTEPVDSSSPIGLAMLRILVALAGLESATTGIRVLGLQASGGRGGQAAACQGVRAHTAMGRNHRDRGGRAREAARREIAGERLASIARDLGHEASLRRPDASGRMRPLVGCCATPGLWVTAPTRGRSSLGAAGRRSWIARPSLDCNWCSVTPLGTVPAPTPQAIGDRVRPVWPLRPEHVDDHAQRRPLLQLPHPTNRLRAHPRARRPSRGLAPRRHH
jgi:hypothetical protein